MLKHTENEQGLTLVELLASITILMIVLITFMSFFTNAFQFNAFSSDKINTTNLAREVQEKFKVDEAEEKLGLERLLTEVKNISGPTTIPKTSYLELNLKEDIVLDSSGILKLSLNDQNYQVLVFVDTHPIPELHSSLFKLHVQVLEHNKILSETFTYIEFH